MDHSHHQHEYEQPRSWWTTPTGIACMLFLAAAAFFLFTEHRAHVVPYLPYLIILACPLMHIFHHDSHGGIIMDHTDMPAYGLWSLVMFPILTYMYIRLALKEEKIAEAEFGNEYRSWAAVTPRFIPKFYSSNIEHQRS